MDILRKNVSMDQSRQQVFEFSFPFFAVRFNRILMLGEADQMRYFVRKGDQESILIQVVVDGDGMAAPISWRAVIAQQVFSLVRDSDTYPVVLYPVKADFHGSLGQVFA